MKVAGPDEREHSAGKGTDETHQNAEVRYEDRHHNGEHDHADFPSQAPDLELAIHRPDGRENRFRPTAEKGALEELAGCVIRQRVREHRFHDQTQVHQALKASRVQVVRDHLLRVVLEGQETDPAEEGFERSRGDVTPVQHPVELGAIDEIALEARQEDLRRIAEDNHAKRDREILYVDRPLHLRPAPVTNLQDTVTDDGRIDEEVRHCAPEAQHGNVLQGLEEAERQQKYPD